MKSIAFIIPYFGKFPEWESLYFETINRNPTIDFHFYTDVIFKSKLPDNIFIHHYSFEEYVFYCNKYLDFKFSPPNPYKLCDLRPLFGLIHENLLKNYDFYGWTDIDVLYGNLRSFLPEEILSKYEVISTHSHVISGHMALFRNTSKHRNKFKKIYKWKEALQNPEFVGIDEHGITNAYLYTIFDKLYFKFKINFPRFIHKMATHFRKRKLYLVEQYTTPFVSMPWIDGTINSNQPDTWYYQDGIITNNRDSGKRFIYLHFMNFKSSKWRHDGTTAPWEKLSQINFASVIDMKSGIVIDKNGIRPKNHS